MEYKFTDRGIPILTLDKKIEALRHCLAKGQDEDALGHICDLLHHVAPGYTFLRFKSAAEIIAYYGADPAPIITETRR